MATDYTRLSDGIRAVGERIEGLGQRMGSLEEKTKPDVILLKLDHLAQELTQTRKDLGKEIGQVQAGVDKINNRVGHAEGSLANHETRIRLVERFQDEQVKPALGVIVDNRVQIATMAAKWGAAGLGTGMGGGLIILIGRGVGLW